MGIWKKVKSEKAKFERLFFTFTFLLLP